MRHSLAQPIDTGILEPIGTYFEKSDDYEKMSQMNRLLDSIIDSSYDGIYVADAKGNGLKVNDAYTRITGVKAQELLGKNMKEIVEKGIVSESVTFKVLRERKAVTIVQRVREKEVLVTGNPLFNDNKEITHVITNVRDLSELNRLKLELRESRKYMKQILDEMNEVKRQDRMNMLRDGVIAQSKQTMKAIGLAQKVSQVDSTVLLLGESGVGKEVFANMIHTNSPRTDKPYIKVNCGAIPPQLLESELFGYEKGAFTGADRNGKAGLFEKADGGTIFLDEIGEVPLELQVKLLRVLQEFEVVRVGGSKAKKVDIRVISATNRDLHKMIEAGDFRKDLFYRLNIVPITIPPLRERKADIAPLAYYFLNKVNERYQFEKHFNPEVIYAMEQYKWPGNIREMENLIERIVVTTDHEELQVFDLPETMLPMCKKQQQKEGENASIDLKDKVSEYEKTLIAEQITKHKTTRKAAQALGISQSSLVKKMKRYNL
ncbi:sigma 54-interacting transcriptional regulator [Bacillus tianshenii]|nr:sigma 54-interacting transcriptional regulator [Bacillus tianshenii]